MATIQGIEIKKSSIIFDGAFDDINRATPSKWEKILLFLIPMKAFLSDGDLYSFKTFRGKIYLFGVKEGWK